MVIKKSNIILLTILIFSVNAFAYWEWTPKSRKWINPKYAVKSTPKEQFEWAEELKADGNLEKAINEHRKLLKHFSDSEYAPESCFMLGELYTQRGDTKKALNYYERLTKNYPGSARVLDAVKAQLDMAEKKVGKTSFRLLRFKEKDKAEVIAGILEEYPYIKEADEKSIQLGKFYIEMKEYVKAKNVLLNLIDKTLNLSIREEAHYLLVCSEYRAVPSKTKSVEGLQKVKVRADAFIASYSDSKYLQEVLDIRNNLLNIEAKKYFDIASYYERVGKTKSADYYYKIVAEKYPDTDYGKISSEKVGPVN
ncbi:outer membrane protein assembly factor BamD [bacterium]|nr:outer membrane protein assembly factor BamD [bacterium]